MELMSQQEGCIPGWNQICFLKLRSPHTLLNQDQVFGFMLQRSKGSCSPSVTGSIITSDSFVSSFDPLMTFFGFLTGRNIC